MPNVLLNGKPNQEFPDEDDFETLVYQLARATNRLKDRSETMETKYKIMQTRLASSEATVSHLLNRVEVLLIDNQELRDRLTELERVTPVGESDVHDLRRKFDIMHQKMAQLEFEVHAARPWYVRLFKHVYEAIYPSDNAGSSDFLELE